MPGVTKAGAELRTALRRNQNVGGASRPSGNQQGFRPRGTEPQTTGRDTYDEQEVSHPPRPVARHRRVCGGAGGGAGCQVLQVGSEISLGEHIQTLSWGTLTLTPEPAVAPVTTCQNVVGGYVTNGEETGEGATSNFATYNCANAGCPAGEVEIGGKKYEKEFIVAATKLPWPSTLIEEEGNRVNSTGVQVSLGCTAHGLANKPGGVPGEPGAQEQFYLAAPTVCITNGAEFQQKPLAVNGKNTTVTSKVEFDSKAGVLSCAGGAVKGKTTGKLKLQGYNESEVITSK